MRRENKRVDGMGAIHWMQTIRRVAGGRHPQRMRRKCNDIDAAMAAWILTAKCAVQDHVAHGFEGLVHELEVRRLLLWNVDRTREQPNNQHHIQV